MPPNSLGALLLNLLIRRGHLCPCGALRTGKWPAYLQERVQRLAELLCNAHNSLTQALTIVPCPRTLPCHAPLPPSKPWLLSPEPHQHRGQGFMGLF